MKLLKQIVIIGVIILFINSFSGDTKQYNVIIYALFIALLLYKFIVNMYQLYKIKSGIIYKGTIMNFSEEASNGTENQKYIIDVSFISPYDSKEYIVESKVSALPKNKSVGVIINEQNPTKSKIYIPSSLLENLSLLIAILAFLYFLFTTIFSH